MTRLVGTGHTVPMPAVAGWTEGKRLAEMASIRADIAAMGGTILREQRVRNIAFDGPGDKTTWTFEVSWKPRGAQ